LVFVDLNYPLQDRHFAGHSLKDARLGVKH